MSPHLKESNTCQRYNNALENATHLEKWNVAKSAEEELIIPIYSQLYIKHIL